MIRKVLIVMLYLVFVGYLQVAGQNYYTNPIIPGFNPDPSICRVENDYYMATSTFEYYPGVPIYHSKDLINWKMIGHALHRPSQLNLDGVNCSGGIFAPTLRYHNGTFYMITTLVGRGDGLPGNFIITATNPAGPWSDPHWIENAPGIDPSLFFDDDGRVYYSGNISPRTRVWDKHRNIWIQEIDINTFQLKGDRVQVLDGAEYYKKNTLDGGIETGMNNYEGSHVYKKGGMYYLMISHGGTSLNHAVSIWQSENIWGPYRINDKNPILTHRDLSSGFSFTSTGHADLVETTEGEWWIVYLAKRPSHDSYIMGRETFMSPVDWSGEWPVINPASYIGKGEVRHEYPKLKESKVEGFPKRDEFNQTDLYPEWTFIRTPRQQWWSLTDRKGMLRIQLRPEKINELVNPSFVGIRQQHYHFTTTLKMLFDPASNNEEAGYAVERDNDNYLKFTITRADKDVVLRLTKKEADANENILKQLKLEKNVSYLRIACEDVLYTFSYSEDGKNWEVLADKENGRFLGLNAGRFTGTFVGMYASSNSSVSSNYADFDWFEYVPSK